MAKNIRRNGKAKNLPLTYEYLQDRSRNVIRKGYSEPKWITFSKVMIARGFDVHLYEAIRTVSKYVTVSNGDGLSFKVRFSNHKPIAQREASGDCDFFVGITNMAVTNTDQAITATLSFFDEEQVVQPW